MHTDFFARRAAYLASQAAADADAASARRAYYAARNSLAITTARAAARHDARTADSRRLAAIVDRIFG